MLATLLKMQRKQMDILGVESGSLDSSGLLASPAFQSAAIGAIAESVEVLDAMNTRARPWVSSSPEEVQRLVAEEVIDLLMYDLEMLSLMGMNEHTVMDAYIRKFTINMARMLEKQTLETRLEAFWFAFQNEWPFGRETRGHLNDAAKLILVMLKIKDAVPEELIATPLAYVKEHYDERNVA